jgi:hypothetical protein
VDMWHRLSWESQLGLGCFVGVVSAVLLVDTTPTDADRLGFIKHRA